MLWSQWEPPIPPPFHPRQVSIILTLLTTLLVSYYQTQSCTSTDSTPRVKYPYSFLTAIISDQTLSTYTNTFVFVSAMPMSKRFDDDDDDEDEDEGSDILK